MCDIWQAICVTHGRPYINMLGSFEAYIRGFTWAVLTSKGGPQALVRGSSKEKEGEGKKRKGGKEKRKRGKERRKEGRKEKKKGEEERKKKEEKKGVLCSEQTRTTKNPELRYKR